MDENKGIFCGENNHSAALISFGTHAPFLFLIEGPRDLATP